jgi:hypothetical protein
LTEQTRQAVDDYLRLAGKKPGEFMFTGRRGTGRSMTTRQYTPDSSAGGFPTSGWTRIFSEPTRFGEPKRL